MNDKPDSEKLLQEIHELKQVVDNTLPLCVTAPDFTIRRVNASFCEMFDTTAENCIGRKCFEVRPGDSCHTPQCPMVRARKQNRELSCTITKSRPDGTPLHVLVTSKPLYGPDGSFTGIVESFLDVTDSVTAEQHLRSSEQNLKAFLRALPETAFLIEKDGTVLEINLKGARRLGISVDEALGRNFFDIIPTEISQIRKARMEEVLGTGRSANFISEYQGRFIHSYISPVFGPDRKVKRLAVVDVDVTTQKRTELEHEKLIHDLQDALEEVKALSGILPICASCKKIRDDEGYWQQVDSYIRDHSEAEFTHGICPDCARELYPELEMFKKKKTE